VGVADDLQLIGDPARADGGFIGFQNIVASIGGDRFKCGFGSQHAGLHRSMAALDPGHVDEARCASDQRAAGKCELWDGLPATLVDRPSAIGGALAALNLGADGWMGLPALKFLEWREVGILVIERDDEAERDLAVGLMIKKPSAPSVLERPSLGMDHSARLMPVGRNIP